VLSERGDDCLVLTECVFGPCHVTECSRLAEWTQNERDPKEAFAPLGCPHSDGSGPGGLFPSTRSAFRPFAPHRLAEALRQAVVPPGPGPKAASGGPLRDRHSPFGGTRSDIPVVLSDSGPTLSGRSPPVRSPVPVTLTKLRAAEGNVHWKRWLVFAVDAGVSRTAPRAPYSVVGPANRHVGPLICLGFGA
jgi:hypothetical protein